MVMTFGAFIELAFNSRVGRLLRLAHSGGGRDQGRLRF